MPGTRYYAPGTECQVQISQYLVPGVMYHVPGMYPCTWFKGTYYVPLYHVQRTMRQVPCTNNIKKTSLTLILYQACPDVEGSESLGEYCARV